MYKIQPTKDQLKRLKGGDKDLILKLLNDSDKNIVRDMKLNKTIDMAFLQGASHVIDRLIELLTMPS